MKLCTDFRQQLKRFSGKRQLLITHSVFKQSVQNAHQLQQHKVCSKMIPLPDQLPINSCGKSFHIINKTVFQLGNVGQHWYVSDSVPVLCPMQYNTLAYPSSALSVVIFYIKNPSLNTCSLRKMYF